MSTTMGLLSLFGPPQEFCMIAGLATQVMVLPPLLISVSALLASVSDRVTDEVVLPFDVRRRLPVARAFERATRVLNHSLGLSGIRDSILCFLFPSPSPGSLQYWKLSSSSPFHKILSAPLPSCMCPQTCSRGRTCANLRRSCSHPARPFFVTVRSQWPLGGVCVIKISVSDGTSFHKCCASSSRYPNAHSP